MAIQTSSRRRKEIIASKKVFNSMKVFAFMLFFFLPVLACFGQDEYVLTKDQHDKIKKNLYDYRLLIKSFDSISTEFKKLTEQYQLTLQLRNRDVEEFKLTESKLNFRIIKERDTVMRERNRISFLEYQNNTLRKEIEKLNKELKVSNKNVILFKSKYYHERKWTAAERIAINVMWATFITFGTYDLVDLIKNNHHY